MKVLEPSGKVAPPVSDVVIGAGELWLPAKELNETMLEMIKDSEQGEQLIQDVDRVLTRHAADFASLFAIKPPSPVDRDELQKCSTEGRYLKGFRGKHVIAYTLVNEAIMLSDMFQINEFIALDLLTVAENELDNYPDWPRGLVAVYMFYEGRMWLMRSLCTIIRCSPGRQWRSNFHPQILLAFRRILNSVFRDDMMDRLIHLLDQFALNKQLEMLENNLALGDSRHRRKIKSLLLQIKEALTQTIFCYGAQRSLRWAELARVLDYLKVQVDPTERPITKGDATLIACAIYTVETSLCPPDTDIPFGHGLRKYLKDNQDGGWKCMELYDVIRLVFLISAHKLPSGAGSSVLSPGSSSFSRPSPGPHGDSLIPPDLSTPPRGGSTAEKEQLMFTLLGNETGDMEFTRNLFGFLQQEIFSHPGHYTWDADIAKVFHGFFVDFITYMPLKLKEIKYRSEEVAKTILICQEQGVSPPIPDVPEYESFLECLGEFYEHDPFELGRYYFLEQSQYLPLSKLVRMCCLESPALFTSCMRFLTGVSTGNSLAMFELLRQNGHNASLDHFFESVARYLQTFGLQMTLESERQFSGQGATGGGSSSSNSTSAAMVAQATSMIMNPMEIRSICSYLRLIELLCTRNETARQYFTGQKPTWIRTALQVVKIRKFPREVRAAMLDACAAMIGEDSLSPDVVSTLWEIFYSTRLLDPGTGDVKEELEEKETRLEEYSLTVGVLRLLRSLVYTRFRQMEFISLEGYFVHPTYDNGAIFPYINYVTEAVFLKMPFRLFKDSNQRWYIMKLCAEILSILLDYQPRLMVQLLCDSPLIRTLLNTLVDCALASDLSSSDSENPLRDEVDRCSLSLLLLLWRALQRQQFYLTQKQEVMESADTLLLLGIHKVMLSTATENGAPDYILSVIRFVDSLFSGPMHMKAALEILSIILEDHTDIDYTVHHALVWHEGISSVFRHTVIELLYKQVGFESLEQRETHDSIKMSALKLIRTSAVHADPNVGLFLLGFDVKKREYVGVRSVLQALLDNAASIPTSFMTLQTLLTDPRLSQATLRVLKYSRFFQGYLREPGMLEQLSFEGLSYFLKCLAIELKSEEGMGSTAQELVGPAFGRIEEVLNMIQLENNSVELPELEFFDGGLVMQALGQCEYVDSELKTRLIRVEKLDGMLKDEIGKLEKSTVLRLRKTVHSEAKEILEFARNLNQTRVREGCKLLVFDGWRQVVEVLALSPQLQQTDFCPGVLRMLLSKVVSGAGGLTEYFLRLAAETTLTLSAVMAGGRECGGTALSLVIHHLCVWLQSAQNPNVRGILYASLLYCVNMLSQQQSAETLLACQGAFPMILHNLCRDCCQGVGERTRMQALFLMGEIIKCTTQRGFGASGQPGGLVASGGGGMGGKSGQLARETGPDWDLDESGERIERRMESQLDSTVDSVCSFEGSFVEGVLDKPGLSSTMNYGRGREPGSQSSSLSWLMQPSRGEKEEGITSGVKRLSGENQDKNGLGGGPSRTNSVHETIMGCVYTNGFLSTLVEALCVVDDIDLIALLTSETHDSSNVLAMRAFFVFEAKLTMLSRLAGVGLKAVMYLLDLNLIKRLTDMKVFELQSYQNPRESQEERLRILSSGLEQQQRSHQSQQHSQPRGQSNNEEEEKDVHVIYRRENEKSWLIPGLGSPVATSTPRDPPPTSSGGHQDSSSSRMMMQQQLLAREAMERESPFAPGGNQTISESLYMQVFKLFHVMLDSAPKNVQVIEQVFQFLRVHDVALAKLLSLDRLTLRNTPRHAIKMLTSLMSKLAGNEQRIRSGIPVFLSRSGLKPGVLNILRVQAERNIMRGDAIATTLVKQVLLFLYHCSKVDVHSSGDPSGKKPKRQISFCVLTNRFELDTMLREQDENVSLGVIMHCVINAAQNIVGSQIKEKKQNTMITLGAPLTSSSGSGGQGQSQQQLSASAGYAASAQIYLTAKMVEDTQTIMEVGLSLLFFHIQLFIQEYQEEKELKRGNRLQAYQEMVGQQVETHLAKVVTEACKKIPNEEYIETLLLKIRRMASASSASGSSSSAAGGMSLSKSFF